MAILFTAGPAMLSIFGQPFAALVRKAAFTRDYLDYSV